MSSGADPLDLFGYIFQRIRIMDSGPPIRNVYDVAGVIASRCFGRFDSYLRASTDFRFLEKFEETANVLFCDRLVISFDRLTVLQTSPEVDLFDSFSCASLRKNDSVVQKSSNDQEGDGSSLGDNEERSNDLANVTAKISRKS